MKKIITTNAGGLPLKQKALAYLQEGHLEILKAIIGHFGIPDVGNFIISGCEIVGVNIAPGMMYIDGELCPFEGASGNGATKIKKNKVNESLTYKNGSSYDFYVTYTAEVNSGGVAFSNFERLPNVSELENIVPDWADITNKPTFVIDPINPNATPPITKTVIERIIEIEKKLAILTPGGGMVLWNKPANLIPVGWAEVANWEGRIPVGVDARVNALSQPLNVEWSPMPPASQNDVRTPGRTDGQKNKTLSVSEMPAHNHSFAAANGGDGGGSGFPATGSPQEGGGTFGMQNTGGGESFSILNPYRTVLFIEYTGV